MSASPLIINEYLADPPSGLAGDANGDGFRDSSKDEFVEVVNSGTVPLDVGHYSISDSTQVRFTFSPRGDYPCRRVRRGLRRGTPTGNFGNAMANGLVFTAGGTGLSLNNSGDAINVKDASGAQ